MAEKDLSPQDRVDLKRARDLIKKHKYDRALPILERLKEAYPKESIVDQYFKMATEAAEGEQRGAALRSSPQKSQSHDEFAEIYRELGLSASQENSDPRLTHMFASLLASETAPRISVDLSVFLAAQHNWNTALAVMDRLVTDDAALRPEIRLWKMRCLLETERYSEVIAAAAGQWSQNYHLPLNYLVGCAYQSLGVKDQARARFEAVKRLNPDYRDVALRLSSV